MAKTAALPFFRYPGKIGGGSKYGCWLPVGPTYRHTFLCLLLYTDSPEMSRLLVALWFCFCLTSYNFIHHPSCSIISFFLERNIQLTRFFKQIVCIYKNKIARSKVSLLNVASDCRPTTIPGAFNIRLHSFRCNQTVTHFRANSFPC